MARVAVPAAGAGVGGRHQGDPAGKTAALTRAADPHLPLLKGLAQLIQHVAAELRQLIEEQHPLVGQAQLPGPGDGAATEQGGAGATVVGAAEGPLVDQPASLPAAARPRSGAG